MNLDRHSLGIIISRILGIYILVHVLGYLPLIPVFLFQNYPHPFNPSTRIRIGVDRPTWLTVRIFNLVGQHVVTLIDGPMEPGEHAIDWRAEGFPAGTYMCRMVTATTVRSIRLMLIK